MSARHSSGSGVTGTTVARHLGKGDRSAQVRTRRLPNGYKVSYRNDYELEVIYSDIFAKNVYFFETENPEPDIIELRRTYWPRSPIFQKSLSASQDCNL